MPPSEQPRMAEADADALRIESAIDEAVTAHGGDWRAAMRELLVQRANLEKARDRALSMVSRGYVRGGPGAPAKP